MREVDDAFVPSHYRLTTRPKRFGKRLVTRWADFYPILTTMAMVMARVVLVSISLTDLHGRG
jgi:hypothetical protein